MKILLTSQSTAFGGVESRLVQEVSVLRQLGCEVDVATPSFPSVALWRQQIQAAGGSIFRWNPYKFIERKQVGLFWRSLVALSRPRLAKGKFNLAHVAMPWTTVGMTRILELSNLGIPVVLGLHCTYPLEKLTPEIYEYVQKALRGVVGAYAVSHSVRNSFLRNFGPLCEHFGIEVITNGVNVNRFTPDPVARLKWRRRLGVEADTYLLAWCGRLVAMKNPHVALEILASPILQGVNVKLALAGSGPEEANLRRHVSSLGLESRVIFAGQIPDVEGFFSGADGCLVTSTAEEGFPLGTCEALACGLPVVASDNEVFREAFGKCGAVTLLPVDDTGAWGNKLKDMTALDVASHITMADIARSYALAQLSEEKMMTALRGYYMTVASRLLLS